MPKNCSRRSLQTQSSPEPMIYLAFHRGESLISRGIRLFEPPYSHVELWFPFQNIVVSADPEGVVEKQMPQMVGSGSGDVVDLFTLVPQFAIPASEEREAFLAARKYVGTGYDYRSLFLGFTAKLPETKTSLQRMICSGVVLQWSRDVGRELLARVQPDRASPRLLSYSPLLRFSHSRILTK